MYWIILAEYSLEVKVLRGLILFNYFNILTLWQFISTAKTVSWDKGVISKRTDGRVLKLQNNSSGWQREARTQRDGDKDREVLGGFGGRQLHCQAPAEHDCITWVNKALGWDVVFNRGVAPQRKMLRTPGMSVRLWWWEQIAWTKRNLLWQCSGLQKHVTLFWPDFRWISPVKIISDRDENCSDSLWSMKLLPYFWLLHNLNSLK